MSGNAGSYWGHPEQVAIEQTIRLADPRLIVDGFKRASVNFPNGVWLHSSHQRLVKGVAPRSSKKSAIEEYAAISVPLHTSDAWTYFGRAIDAIAQGAGEVGQHLLYYSELRAATALLNHQGIVRPDRRVAVCSTSGVLPVPIPSQRSTNTHFTTWVAFREWSQTSIAQDFVGHELSMRGVDLIDWVGARPSPAIYSAAIADIMREQLGIDIKRYSEDRDLRNRLSYEPTRVRMEDVGLTGHAVRTLISDVWTVLAPGVRNSFESLDMYLIRRILAALEVSTNGTSPIKSARNGDLAALSQWATAAAGQATTDLVEFMATPPSSDEPRLLAEAGMDLSSAQLASQLVGMTGRALILLRLATGATKDLMMNAGVRPAHIDFWLRDMLAQHAIPVPTDNDYSSLYEDHALSSALDDLSDVDIGSEPGSLARLIEAQGGAVKKLVGFERVPAWAVA